MISTYTTHAGTTITFDVVVDDILQNLSTNNIDPNNKALLSLVNGFESGKWRRQQFEQFIWNNIKDTALSQTEKEALIGDEQTILTKSAKNLRLLEGDEKGGEIGEILLYGIMKKYYSALPVVPKIFYKQNRNDYAKGADSIHITLNTDGTFSLWLGEAKFYNSIKDTRLDSIIESVHNIFIDDKLRKELSIVTSLKDLDLFIEDKKLLKDIKDKLADGISLDDIKQQLHVPILILHQCEITASNTESFDEYKKKMREEHIKKAEIFMKKQDIKLNSVYMYKEIKFHLILFPVPNKSELVDRFYTKAMFERDED
ncbi:MAG: hypothetical protein A2513_03080 [Sulfurimonas sp. RIFOXYD12_FULL_33_39]|uniref:HamA C-terminal domain-containing protein n=1 Tax=unclassified Sulfurimonas TaxID=2623549 RepID=UPI0008B34D18|nr:MULTISPECIES: DUF1837 domain-containing protein [unclassified Sulfurimonas]OHE08975.1 MAG: hypothetical protein A2513_03080 [Sulfurimonas sp. RIFOXYD12_FULL_33_39]OHE14285.1 MAG: hypothetical protein A2530_06380 [Sulfurimonas sp. RIFOXYD2_FULL_34_21]